MTKWEVGFTIFEDDVNDEVIVEAGKHDKLEDIGLKAFKVFARKRFDNSFDITERAERIYEESKDLEDFMNLLYSELDIKMYEPMELTR